MTTGTNSFVVSLIGTDAGGTAAVQSDVKRLAGLGGIRHPQGEKSASWSFLR
jgi:hypothetical protein